MKDSELAEGAMATRDLDGVRVLLARVGGDVFAVGATCTHEEADLGLGFLLEDRVVCPLHLSQFSLRTGEVANPPAESPLRCFKVKIDGGTIFVEV